MPNARQQIKLEHIALTTGADGGRREQVVGTLDLFATVVDEPTVRREEESTVVFDFDNEFQVRRIPFTELVDKTSRLTVDGERWDIVSRRFFGRGGRERWVGIQAKRPQ